MNKKKSFKDISWLVTEEEYREDSALSYSTLAKYERGGFNTLETLFDKVESPSLTFGSAVDSIITGGEQEFNDRFIVADFPEISSTITTIITAIFNDYKDTYINLIDIPESIIIDYTNNFKYQLNWKLETRVKVLKEKGAEYYNLLYISNNKTLLDTKTYEDVQNSVQTLKESDATKFYFQTDNPFDDIERLYQLKFKSTFNGINYRIMADLIIVNHKEKWVMPIDLKTSSHYEWDFHKSFIDWNYQIQARLYWATLRQNMDNDEYFQDFELKDYRFIVINRKTLTPLVWECPFTQRSGTLELGKNKNIILRHPFTIGEELSYYLKYNPKTPKGINITNLNNLETWINAMEK